MVAFMLEALPLLPTLPEPLLELGFPVPEAEPFIWLPELVPGPLMELALPAEPPPIDAPPVAPPAPPLPACANARQGIDIATKNIDEARKVAKRFMITSPCFGVRTLS